MLGLEESSASHDVSPCNLNDYISLSLVVVISILISNRYSATVVHLSYLMMCEVSTRACTYIVETNDNPKAKQIFILCVYCTKNEGGVDLLQLLHDVSSIGIVISEAAAHHNTRFVPVD